MTTDHWREISRFVWYSLWIGGLAYDVAVIAAYGRSASITEAVRQDAAENPIAVLLVGIVIGHLFFWK